MNVNESIWKIKLHKLSKLHYKFISELNEIYESQVGLLNRCFYHPCSFCGESGGIYHTFFSCQIAEKLGEQISKNISLQHIPGINLRFKNVFIANKIIKYLMFCNKEYYKNRKQNSNTNKKQTLLKFLYEI